MKLSKGFTLIELIVVMAVFLFVTGTAFIIFISIVGNQNKVLAEQQILNQISYVEEYMSKALRMAAKDDIGTCLGQAGYIYRPNFYDVTLGVFQGIKFINQTDFESSDNPGGCQQFYLENGVLKEIKGNGSPIALTSSSLEINSIKFVINGTDGSMAGLGCQDPNQCLISNNNGIQPRLTIILDVKIPGDNQQPSRIIQTTVSARNLN